MALSSLCLKAVWRLDLDHVYRQENCTDSIHYDEFCSSVCILVNFCQTAYQSINLNISHSLCNHFRDVGDARYQVPLERIVKKETTLEVKDAKQVCQVY